MMKALGLQELCLQLLARHIDVCPSLEYIPADLCDRLFEIVLALYPATPQTLRLLGALCPQNLSTLDLTRVRPLDEKALSTLLVQTPDLRVLLLQDDGTLTSKLLVKVVAAGRATLRSLSLTKVVNLDDAALKHLAGLTRLEVLRLDGWKKLTPNGLQHLVPLVNLRELSLAHCTQITGLGSASKKFLPHLKFLNLSSSGVRGKALAEVLQVLEGACKLKRLILRGTSLAPSMLLEKTFAAPVWNRLTVLSLAGNPHIGRPQDLTSLAKLRSLVALDLSLTLVTTEGVKLLGKLLGSTLKVLGLSETHITEEVMSVVAAGTFPSLILLDLTLNKFPCSREVFCTPLSGNLALRFLDLGHCEWGEAASGPVAVAPPRVFQGSFSVIFSEEEHEMTPRERQAAAGCKLLWASYFDIDF